MVSFKGTPRFISSFPTQPQQVKALLKAYPWLILGLSGARLHKPNPTPPAPVGVHDFSSSSALLEAEEPASRRSCAVDATASSSFSSRQLVFLRLQGDHPLSNGETLRKGETHSLSSVSDCHFVGVDHFGGNKQFGLFGKSTQVIKYQRPFADRNIL